MVLKANDPRTREIAAMGQRAAKRSRRRDLHARMKMRRELLAELNTIRDAKDKINVINRGVVERALTVDEARVLRDNAKAWIAAHKAANHEKRLKKIEEMLEAANGNGHAKRRRRVR